MRIGLPLTGERGAAFATKNHPDGSIERTEAEVGPAECRSALGTDDCRERPKGREEQRGLLLHVLLGGYVRIDKGSRVKNCCDLASQLSP